jgi:NAD(P)H dehydrogenase (quinone)
MQAVRIFSVIAHPSRGSFTGALLDACLDGALSAGHAADRADLYLDRFDPVFQDSEYAQYEPDYRPADEILAYQHRMGQADAWVFAFPIWWWSMPAMMKGWIDRVFSSGFAYRDAQDGMTGLFADRPVVLLTPCALGEASIARHRYGDAFRRTTLDGVFGYCGIRDVRWHLFSDVGSEAARRQHLAQARDAGLRI